MPLSGRGRNSTRGCPRTSYCGIGSSPVDPRRSRRVCGPVSSGVLFNNVPRARPCCSATEVKGTQNTIEFTGANLVIAALQNPYEPCFLLLRRSHRVQQEDPSPDAASLNEHCSHAGRTPSLAGELGSGGECVLEKARSGSLWRLRTGARPRGDDRRCWLLCDRCTWAQLDISDDALDSRNVPGSAGRTLKLHLRSRRTDQVHRPFLRIDCVVA